MSFFRGGGFNDPFFGDLNHMMRNQNTVFDPFGMLGGGFDEGRIRTPREQMINSTMPDSNGRQNRHRGSQQQSLMQPFGFGFGGGLFGGLMRQMEQMQSQAFNDPNCHVYSQSTVISMKPGRDGRTQVYEATESVRKTGDVKETRRSVRDSGRGVEKLEIGHHIGERGHVIEKRRDQAAGGQIRENQKFIGVNEDDAEKFDQEWTRATREALRGERYFLDDESNVGPFMAIEGGRSNRREQGSPYARGSSSHRYVSGSPGRQRKPKSRPVVRVEEPEEPVDKKEEKRNSKGGPKIVEME